MSFTRTPGGQPPPPRNAPERELWDAIVAGLPRVRLDLAHCPREGWRLWAWSDDLDLNGPLEETRYAAIEGFCRWHHWMWEPMPDPEAAPR